MVVVPIVIVSIVTNVAISVISLIIVALLALLSQSTLRSSTILMTSPNRPGGEENTRFLRHVGDSMVISNNNHVFDLVDKNKKEIICKIRNRGICFVVSFKRNVSGIE